MMLLLAVVGGYLIYTHYMSPAATAKPPGQAPATGAQCKFPDGTLVAPNADGTCPFDATHQGQSTPVTG